LFVDRYKNFSGLKLILIDINLNIINILLILIDNITVSVNYTTPTFTMRYNIEIFKPSHLQSM